MRVWQWWIGKMSEFVANFAEKLQVSGGDSSVEDKSLVRVESYTKVHEDLGKITFMYWLLVDSIYVWIGQEGSQPVMPHLVMASVSDRQKQTALTTDIAKYSGNDIMAKNIAKRCALKTKKVVFITCTLTDTPEEPVSRFVEAEIVSKITRIVSS